MTSSSSAPGSAGLACAVRLAARRATRSRARAGDGAGGKAGRVELGGGFALRHRAVAADDAVGAGGALRADGRAAAALELVRVEPVTRYRFADGSARRPQRRPAAGDRGARGAGRPGAGRRLGALPGRCAAMWRASVPFLTGPPPWPPRRPAPGRPDPRPARRSCACGRGTTLRGPRPRARAATRGCGWSSSASRPTRAPTRAARPPRSPSPATSSTPSARGTCAAGSTASSRRWPERLAELGGGAAHGRARRGAGARGRRVTAGVTHRGDGGPPPTPSSGTATRSRSTGACAARRAPARASGRCRASR